jgi:hypothetical protein
MLRPGALLEIFLIFSLDSRTPINHTLLFLTGKDDYSQDRLLVIQLESNILKQMEVIFLLLYLLYFEAN